MGRAKPWNPELRGAAYRPTMTVQGFSSRGKSTRLACYTTGRVHHLFSQTEYFACLLYDWIPEITDIREQYALPIDETVAIAGELGIDHITDEESGSPHTVTSDFVLTRTGPQGEGDVVRSCKKSDELSNPRTLSKLEVERQFWLRRSVEWKLVTERDLPATLIRNLEFLHPFRDSASTSVQPEHREALISNLWSRLTAESSRTLAAICTDLDLEVGLKPGSHLGLSKYALANRRWAVDMHAEISGGTPLPLLPQAAGKVES